MYILLLFVYEVFSHFFLCWQSYPEFIIFAVRKCSILSALPCSLFLGIFASFSVQIDEQILTLARAYQLPSEALSLRLSLLSFLQTRLRSAYPSSLLLPFGSTVLGLATPSSDLDVALLSEPSVDDNLFFIESGYMSGINESESTQGMRKLPNNRE